jgi:ribonuclease PH
MADREVGRQGRGTGEFRELRIDRDASAYAEGSCLIRMGSTHVLCTASVEEGVPGWRKGSGAGWVTAEYAMLPRATQQRTSRERGQLGGRTQEIQRLIGRSLRACVDLRALGEWTVRVDCDVLQADGGTRTASITGGAVALKKACDWIDERRGVETGAFRQLVAAISVGVVDGEVLLDLDYSEDSRAEVDLNVVAVENGDLIEVQGTAERAPFTRDQLGRMMDLAAPAIDRLVAAQRAVLR